MRPNTVANGWKKYWSRSVRPGVSPVALKPQACDFDAMNHVGSSEEMDLVSPVLENTSDPEARRQVAAAVPTWPHYSWHCSLLLVQESASDVALDD